ncbi:MAG: tetratricopeptide repeat protein, partial [Planctomycetes bacterium]|nr:tetratricopeptide repeat protein [Planctomycetota bacterium]
MDENLITPSDFFHRGLELLEHGKYLDALKHFEAAVDRDYFDNDIHLPMGEALFEIGRYQDALDHFSKTETEDQAAQAEILLWKGSCFLELRKPRRAISAFNRVIEMFPDHAEAHFKRGLALADTGGPERALEAFETAQRLLEKQGPDADAEPLGEVLMWKGRVLVRMGRREEGLELLLKAAETAPDHPGPYNEIADAFRLSGDLRTAEDWYKKGLARLPDDPALHNDYGNLLRELGRYQESLQHLTAAIEREAVHSVAYYNRALTLERMDLHDEALKDFDAVIEANPDDLDARLRKLDLMTQLNLFADARALLDALTPEQRKTPECIDCEARLLNRQAAVLERSGDMPGALELHQRVLSLHPDFLDLETPAPGDERYDDRLARLQMLALGENPGPLACLLAAAAGLSEVHSRLAGERGKNGKLGRETRDKLKGIAAGLNTAIAAGCFPALAHKLQAELSFYELEKDKAALEHADEALRLCPDYVGALWIKAIVLVDGLSRPDLAFECYRRMLQITPSNSSVLVNMADLCLEFGQPQRALHYYRRVLEERPGDTSVARDIGHCYLALQRYGDAIAAFSRLMVDGEGEAPLDLVLDMAEAYYYVGEWSEATTRINAVRAANAQLDPALEARATELEAALALGRGKPKQTLKLLNAIPENLVTSFGLLQGARAHIELGEPAAARETLVDVLENLSAVTPDAVEARYHLARISYMEKQPEQALEHLQQMGTVAPFDERVYRLSAWVLRMQGDLDGMLDAEEDGRVAQQLSKVVRLLH